MNKKVMGKKFSRDTTSRRAMYRALVRSFVLNGVLVTTHSKAKVIIPIFDKLINRARGETVSDKRFVYGFCGNDSEVPEKLFELSKNIKPVKGSCLKYTNLPSRKGDNAPMAKVELAQKIEVEKVTKPNIDSKAVGKKKSQKVRKNTEGTEKKTSVVSVIKKLSLKKKDNKK